MYAKKYKILATIFVLVFALTMIFDGHADTAVILGLCVVFGAGSGRAFKKRPPVLHNGVLVSADDMDAINRNEISSKKGTTTK